MRLMSRLLLPVGGALTTLSLAVMMAPPAHAADWEGSTDYFGYHVGNGRFDDSKNELCFRKASGDEKVVMAIIPDNGVGESHRLTNTGAAGSRSCRLFGSDFPENKRYRAVFSIYRNGNAEPGYRGHMQPYRFTS